jgi:hypothetical protein
MQKFFFYPTAPPEKMQCHQVAQEQRCNPIPIYKRTSNGQVLDECGPEPASPRIRAACIRNTSPRIRAACIRKPIEEK